MNSETGRIYHTERNIRAAMKRGEPLEPIGPRVSEFDKHGQPYNRTGQPTTRRERRFAARMMKKAVAK